MSESDRLLPFGRLPVPGRLAESGRLPESRRSEPQGARSDSWSHGQLRYE